MENKKGNIVIVVIIIVILVITIGAFINSFKSKKIVTPLPYKVDQDDVNKASLDLVNFVNNSGHCPKYLELKFSKSNIELREDPKPGIKEIYKNLKDKNSYRKCGIAYIIGDGKSCDYGGEFKEHYNPGGCNGAFCGDPYYLNSCTIWPNEVSSLLKNQKELFSNTYFSNDIFKNYITSSIEGDNEDIILDYSVALFEKDLVSGKHTNKTIEYRRFMILRDIDLKNLINIHKSKYGRDYKKINLCGNDADYGYFIKDDGSPFINSELVYYDGLYFYQLNSDGYLKGEKDELEQIMVNLAKGSCEKLQDSKIKEFVGETVEDLNRYRNTNLEIERIE